MWAYQHTADDVENVLRDHATRVVNTEGKPLDVLAEELVEELDDGAIEKAALRGGVDLDDQTTAANEEILRQLIERGLISGLTGGPTVEASLNPAVVPLTEDLTLPEPGGTPP
jgi:uncharacterized NAD(P)/FAD-binding protein YdhS